MADARSPCPCTYPIVILYSVGGGSIDCQLSPLRAVCMIDSRYLIQQQIHNRHKLIPVLT